MIYSGTITARSHAAPAPASQQTYTIVVHTDEGDVPVAGARPWVVQWPDAICDSVPYPLSTQVICVDLNGEWRFLFPGQTPHTTECGA